MRTTAAFWVVALCLLLGAVVAAPAGAHAALSEISPEPGSTLQEPPTEVVLGFNENVSITDDAIRIFDPAGRQVSGIEVSGNNSTVTATLPELTEEGSYTVDWKTVSADGHPIRGAYLFHLRTATLTEPFDAGGSGSPLVANVMRSVGATLALLALTGVLAAALQRRRGVVPTSGWYRWRWVLAFNGTLLLFVGALAVVGSSFSEAFSVTLDTSSGKVALLACVLAAIGVVVSLIPRASASPAEPVLGGLTIAAIAMQGHAVSLPPVAVSAPLTVLHVAAAVTWGVGLVWLDQRCRSARPDEVRSDVERLSPFAMGAVVVLALTGAVLVFDRVPLDQLVSSTYGRLGLVKLVLLAATVVVAFRNRSSVTPDLPDEVGADARADDEATDDGATVTRLRKGVRAEIVLLSVALIAGAVLSQISPPDPDASNGGDFRERVEFGEGEVELTVEPGARGTNEVHVVALGEDGRLMGDLTEMTLSLSLKAEDVGPLEPEMQVVTPGHSLSYADFPLEGTWTVVVDARLGKFEALTATFEVPIGPR